jgi:hypothetical protein
LKCNVIHLHGPSIDMTLHEVKYVLELWVNLFSLNRASKYEFKLRTYQSASLKVKFRSLLIGYFAQQMVLFLESNCQFFHLQWSRMQQVWYAKTNVSTWISFITWWVTLGLRSCRKLLIFSALSWLEMRQDCAIPKERQKNLNKEWQEESQVPKERIWY